MARTNTPYREWTIQTVRDRCDEVGECWIWKHSCKQGRYPQATIHARTGLTVRAFVYDELLNKPRPKGSTIGSSCGELKCCNPAHLVWKSRSYVIEQTYRNGKRNMTRMTLDRRAKAIEQGWAKLDMEKATEIRMRRNESSGVLGREFGVDPSTIRSIWNGRLWKPTGPASIFNLGG